jgi:hypothetical protein
MPVSGKSAGFAAKQLVGCGFFTIAPGYRLVTVWSRSDEWRTLSAEEARHRVKRARLPPPRTSKPTVRPVPKTVKPVKPEPVATLDDPITPRRQPSLPRLACLERPPLE